MNRVPVAPASGDNPLTIEHPWREVEFDLAADSDYLHPYTDVDVWVDFAHDSGVTLRRPAFWNGGTRWSVRFAGPVAGSWTWRSDASAADPGLVDVRGEIVVGKDAPVSRHAFYEHGFWKMSSGGRSLVHADGAPAILVGDTAWGLPWRAT